MRPIVIVPPIESWPAEYIVSRDALLPAAPRGSYCHHIGSTAVPGLVAKDVIDIQVTVDDLDRLDDAAFENAGFRRTCVGSDHCPDGLELDASELSKRFYRGRHRAANVHVRVRGRFNQRFALICRDFLRARPGAAAAYGSVKQRLAERFGRDAEAYDDIKDPICDLIVEGANVWAELTGWVEPMAD